MGAIILWIAMFMFLVIIHELWHFLLAKKSGVKVHEFGIWIPPKVTKMRTDKSWTDYTINRIPLWGFVRLKWEDPSDKETFLAPDSFISATLPKKIAILLWWVLVNALFAWIAFSIAFAVWTKPISVLPESALAFQSQSYLMPSMSFAQEQWLIERDASGWLNPAVLWGIDPEWLWARLWLAEWDEIVSVNGEEVSGWTLWARLQEAIWWPLEIVYRPADWSALMTTTGACWPDSCLLGVAIAWPGYALLPIKMSIPDAFIAWLHEIAAQTDITMKALWWLGRSLFSFNKEKISWSVDKLAWPVGVVAFGQQLFYQQWRIGFLGFAGIISLALALFNILPIPALDGGRIVSVLIQAIGRFKPSSYFVIENYINIFFFVLLMLFGIFIIYKDILMVQAIY